ncbi:hypothetical protein HYFRA_00002164 [Hymenoscyphus fraxineus]|uniref:pectinesterase n=1 Tax=Hymenoscyphus fraxineus TaxID=746836 RepID=A0A9N9KLB9_9HELO|nr:hypothetical protein HYFRA_00002164 [Hymenoscyphus fraxineus]
MLLSRIQSSWLSMTLVVIDFLTLVNADTSTFSKCQSPTLDPLTDCPSNTILVSATDSNANFTSIQSAILSLDETTPSTILILPGIYNEQLNVTRSGPLTLLGQIKNTNQQSENTVTISWASANQNNGIFTDNAFTSVLTVAPTLEASLTGAGPTGYAVPENTPFGNIDFKVYNIDFRNVFSEKSDGPSLAVSVSRANAGFYYSGFYSYQDTVYVGKLGNAYFYRNTIAGQTDFLYGFGTAWIQNSTLSLRNCGGGITAWKGANTTFPNKYGVFVSDSTVVAANSTIAPTIAGKCFLGRPWNSQHLSVFSNTYLDATINGAGYKKWSTDPAQEHFNANWTKMAEYHNSGPGFDLDARIKGNVTIELTADEARKYATPKDVFMDVNGTQPFIDWIDKDAYTW